MFTVSLLLDDCHDLKAQLARLSFDEQQTMLVQLFSDQVQTTVLEMAGVILERFPQAHLLGLSSEQVIYHSEIYFRKTLVLISVFQETSLTSSIVPYEDELEQNSELLLRDLNIGLKTQAMICFADRFDLATRSFFRIFSTAPENLPIAGGCSCMTRHGQWVLYGKEIYHNAFVAVAMHGHRLWQATAGYSEWNPIGKAFEVTEVKQDIVYRLDDLPIRRVYNQYLGNGNELPFEFLQNFPFLGEEGPNQHTFIPLSQTLDEGISFDYPLKVGDKVRFSYDHPLLTLEQVYLKARQLESSQPQQFFVYSCVSRLSFMEENQEFQPLQKVANTDGCYCMGEFFRQKIMHHSMTFLALREGDCPPARRSRVDAHYLGSVSPLFSLIRNSFLDLDEMNLNMANKLQAQAEALMQSYRTDPLTGLPNRAMLRERLARLAENEHLLSVKLTNFSRINEKYGYQVGDQIVQDLTRYFVQFLEEELPGRSTLFSIGIGEWAAVFASNYSSEGIHYELSLFIDQLENMNFEPAGLPEVDYLSVSICTGMVSKRSFPDEDVDDLLMKSIEARRIAAQENKHFCDAGSLRHQEVLRQEQLNWLSCVSRAILNDHVLVYAQPIVEADNHRVSSYEMLVRIEDDGEIILPGHFLPVIEGTHLYTHLSRQLITRTFEVMNPRTESFSINLSPQDFMSERTLDHLENAIRLLDDPSRVGLEVLETEQIKDYGHMIDVCNHFRKLGVKIIVDDFGSGYSNIDEIIKLEPQVIKIDGSLIRNIDHHPKQRKIARQLIQLCQVLNAKTVAEFVHNETICRIVEDMGVDYMQGFYLGKPKPLK
ncbi:bifunctional diguanylate cyclase/phosphodiesterase [Vibrio mangrovi]|uniref:Cyclic di-GMP phosphodiesterase YfgF n=1 Tax=Vibrio mangrovi TaxID=474394 RepID=A0A1Y6IW88_9VIBR|nr:EAL domain-containing protein [Vibrio mangrovi]MDW6002580.1 EAL domain-containing protein [Vibrio mangrovi]SMS01888.1 Cyclic di-GMP phosphodiesterase YfgF [Vibrio mangrovi]